MGKCFLHVNISHPILLFFHVQWKLIMFHYTDMTVLTTHKSVPRTLQNTAAFMRAVQYSLCPPVLYSHALTSWVHTCCCKSLGVNKGFLLRFNDVFIPSGSLNSDTVPRVGAKTGLWVRDFSSVTTHTHKHTCRPLNLPESLEGYGWEKLCLALLRGIPHPPHELVEGTCK